MGNAVDLAGSGLLCCSSLPSDIFICNRRGLHSSASAARLEKHLKEDGCGSLSCLLSSISPPGWRAPRCLLALVATTPIPSSVLLILQ